MTMPSSVALDRRNKKGRRQGKRRRRPVFIGICRSNCFLELYANAGVAQRQCRR
jgi:hypothetical protein